MDWTWGQLLVDHRSPLSPSFLISDVGTPSLPPDSRRCHLREQPASRQCLACDHSPENASTQDALQLFLLQVTFEFPATRWLCSGLFPIESSHL